jgi:hypothetical protein
VRPAFKDFKLLITAKAGTEGKLFGSDRHRRTSPEPATAKAGHKVCARRKCACPTGPAAHWLAIM